jgi:hypothetical protein
MYGPYGFDGNCHSFGFMPLRKDYLLDQLRDFFAALTRIAARIQAGELERAEEEIDALTSSAAMGELFSAEVGSPVPEHIYAGWKFQVQLLLLKIRVLEARGLETLAFREQAVHALRRLIDLRPDIYDIELREQLRGMEERGDDGPAKRI